MEESTQNKTKSRHPITSLLFAIIGINVICNLWFNINDYQLYRNEENI